MKTQLIVGAAALVVGLLLGWMVRGVATYNVHQASIASYDDWRVACPESVAENKDAHCELSTDVVDKSQGNPNTVGRVTITNDKDGKAMMGVVLPYGDALAKSLGSADDVALMFAGLDGKAVQVPMSFKGYQKSVSAWKSADAKRNSWFWRLWS